MGTIVLYPSPGMGHLVAMVELGKFIITYHPSFKITVLTIPPSFNTGSTESYIRHVSDTIPAITFHLLPAVLLDLDSFPSMESIIFQVMKQSNPHIRCVLQNIPSVSAFIIDVFCSTAVSISNDDLRIPTYCFGTSGASAVALTLYLSKLDKITDKSFKDMKNTLIHAPGLPPIPSSDMWRPIFDRESDDYKNFLNASNHFPNLAGILVNTFEKLQTKCIKAIREGKCNPDGNTPPIYCVGPLLASGSNASQHDCLKWLNIQPKKSVVFLSFGSLGVLSAKQLKEIAKGLEISGHRFLWIVRSPPSNDKSKKFLPPPEPDLHSLLPEGFLDRTRDIGYTVKSWAPQVEILNHDSIGGFVTHCGWNSILEAVSAGVPMLAWPLYAEQHFNRVVMVEDMKIALRVNELEDGFIVAGEVGRAVKELMDSDSEKGNMVQKVVKELGEEAKIAMNEGGSSIVALSQLSKLWSQKQ